MFCMGCGAEVPPRAAVCAVCGRATGHGGEVRAAPAPADVLEQVETTGSHSMPPPRAAPPALSSAPLAAPRPSISSGDLDHTGFPRDALGRALIFIVLAMAADLLAPWVNLGGSRVAPSSLGLLPLLALAWLSLAVLPLLHPSLRSTPLYAVAPLVVGATCLGLGAAVWARVTLLDTQTTANSGFYSLPPGDTTASSVAYTSLHPLTTTSNSADVGLYLFLAGAIVLIVAGYQMFLAAAHAQARAELRTETTPPPTQLAVLPGMPAPAAPRAARNGHSALDGVAAGAGSVSRPLPLPPPPTTPSAPQAPQAAPDGRRGVALPGSPAWNQTPTTPDFQRPSPSLGWRQHGP